MTKYLILFSVFFPAFLFVSGGAYDAIIERSEHTQNNGEIAQANGFTTLAVVLSKAGLIDAPQANMKFTVFAPTNAASQPVLESNSAWKTLGDIPQTKLISVLTYHVVPARVYDKDLSSALNAAGELPTANGGNIKVNLSTLSLNNTSNIKGTNYNATNGVIHVIDAVLLP